MCLHEDEAPTCCTSDRKWAGFTSVHKSIVVCLTGFIRLCLDGIRQFPTFRHAGYAFFADRLVESTHATIDDKINTSPRIALPFIWMRPSTSRRKEIWASCGLCNIGLRFIIAILVHGHFNTLALPTFVHPTNGNHRSAKHAFIPVLVIPRKSIWQRHRSLTLFSFGSLP